MITYLDEEGNHINVSPENTDYIFNRNTFNPDLIDSYKHLVEGQLSVIESFYDKHYALLEKSGEISMESDDSHNISKEKDAFHSISGKTADRFNIVKQDTKEARKIAGDFIKETYDKVIVPISEKTRPFVNILNNVKDNITQGIDSIKKDIALNNADSLQREMKDYKLRINALKKLSKEKMAEYKSFTAKKSKECHKNVKDAIDRMVRKVEKQNKPGTLKHFINRFSEKGRLINSDPAQYAEKLKAEFYKSYNDKTVTTAKDTLSALKTLKKENQKSEAGKLARMILKDRKFLLKGEQIEDSVCPFTKLHNRAIKDMNKSIDRLEGKLQTAKEKYEKTRKILDKEKSQKDFEKSLRKVVGKDKKPQEQELNKTKPNPGQER